MGKKNNKFNSGIANDSGPAGNTAPQDNAIAPPTIQKQDGPGSVREQIRAAGADGNLGKKELLKITKSTGKDADRIIRQLDKVNTKSASNNKAPIGLGSAAANSLLKTRTNGTMFGQSMDDLGLGIGKYANYGKGAIGQAILQAKGTYNYDTNSFTQGTGRIPQGQQVFGSYNGAPQLQIKPQNNVNAGFTGPGGGTDNPKVITDPINKDPVVQDPITPNVAEEPVKPIFQSANNDNLSGNATGFRTSKSSWKKSGKNMAGTNSLKIKPTGLASGVGLSVSGRM